MSRVVVGMSGGVDSSVAAYLLKQQGYEVIGVTMRLWQQGDAYEESCAGGCCGMEAAEDARAVADRLGIRHYVMNFSEVFREKVVDYFAAEYCAGRTPNPCIACNRYVKWETLLQRAMELGAEAIATGHYARLLRLPNGRLALQQAVGIEKDQTYALYSLTQAQLARTLFPVGAYSKPQIRAFAEELGLAVANKPDSQEICFVPDKDYAGFLQTYLSGTSRKAVKDGSGADERVGAQEMASTGGVLGAQETASTGGVFVAQEAAGIGGALRGQETAGAADVSYAAAFAAGDFVDEAGRVLGKHQGIVRYTVGQRKGLGAFGKPMFVKELRPARNEIVLAEGNALLSETLMATALNYMALPAFTARALGELNGTSRNTEERGADGGEAGLRARAKIRYNHTGADCTVTVKDGILYCKFDEPQRAVTPGQALVLYEKDSGVVLGGGVITGTSTEEG